MPIGSAKLIPEFPGRPLSASPGCYFCGQDKGRDAPGVLDLNHYIDMEGYVFLCVACVEWLAGLCGLLSRREVEKLQEKVAELGASNRKLGMELKSANSIAKAMETLVADMKKLK